MIITNIWAENSIIIFTMMEMMKKTPEMIIRDDY